ncbi:MAG TPA: DUF4175 family protein [Pirellulales bacterium]|nr:DUF4175 family protein [Pirellulales bacterium]
MSQAQIQSSFVRRFDRIWIQARRVQLWQAACWSLLTALAGIALVAALDYEFELSRRWRLAAAAANAAASLAVALGLAARSLRRWRRNATATTIERVFPQLGQRIRTTVQYGDLSRNEIQASGATTTLVAALEDDTVRRAQPLPLDAVVPWKTLALASLLAATVGLLLAGTSAFDWQWRIAAQRALLGDEAYTKLTVSPGNASLKEGESLRVEVVVEGRTGEHVSFRTRRRDEDDREWREELIGASDGKSAGDRRLAFEFPLDRLRHPLEYRVAAGSAESETYQVDVRYPLKIVDIRAAIQPPAYTGLTESVVEGGDVTALVGSRVKLMVELDRPPAAAWIEMRDAARVSRQAPAAAERTPLAIDGARLSTEFEVVSDKTYAVVAEAADGMRLAENKHRLRARRDEPPQVWFESPAEALESHTLAEILMRIRTSDDFGLSRAGIVFQINNEEEYPLLEQDFQAAAAELETTGKLSPQTRATLEKVLPLEHFALTQRDSVMYYAFAEDIRPGSPQRSETDLRFIDIRPFRLQYRLLDLDAAGMNQGPQLKTLEELIARQRHALNRAVRLSRVFEHTGQADISAVDSLTKFEAELAASTRELAEGLRARGVDETELLFQAESSMLAATDSLSAGKYDRATLQMRDALKDLIEGRNRLQIFIFKNPDRAQLAALRQFDRMQRQKLRRPKTDEEESKEIARRLQELADSEEFVYASLSGIIDPDAPPVDMKSQTAGESSGAAEAPPEDPAEPESDQPQAGGKEEASDDDGPRMAAARAALRELEDRQLDAALDAREVEKALDKMKKISELAKERMAAAAKSAEEAAAALDGGEKETARAAAGEAGTKFRELAEQVKALLAQEQADRIAAAQQMAADLARRQQEFKDRLADANGTDGGGGDKPSEAERPKPAAGMAADAQRIADKAETLNDVLAAAAKADSPEDQASAKKVDDLMDSLDLKALAQRLADLPDQVRDGKLEDARNAAGDGAERMEVAAARLAALRRAIVDPRVDELAKLEAEAAGLDDRLDRLDTDARVSGWHVDADDLLERLDDAGIDEKLRDEFSDEMRRAGWGSEVRRRRWDWGRDEGGYYSAPAAYRRLLSRLAISLRTRMQELMLGDLSASGDEPIPPQYQDLVDRYYQILASEKR